ncbi:HlyD family efflux transporter periplasmic adaptor subunit [Dokdonella sp.]|uniref:HlyD family secretion protein n=1 Tax=Dokdonella sp. TaxID=2291710 RepID=UPI001B100D65|nr:HlyD family efflux transporter periplasmic adaptor subunit [Dokdonella sp.]MBO9664010.1 HlyD family efflux transporter periplasmic adaptor subunit [Dokdonella sp.]
MSTANPTAGETAVPTNGRRRFLLRLVLLAVVLAAIGVGLWYYTVSRWYESTDDAYVNGNVVQITPQVAGTVVRIQADNGDLVHKGDVMVEIDGSDARIALQQAEANLARTVRQVRGLYSNVESGQALVAAQKVTLDRVRADYARRKGLATTGAISAEELAHARDALAAAESQLASTQQQLSTSKALVDETVIARHPDVLAAAATLRTAWLADVRSKIYAPVDGYVAQRTVQVGQRIQPGTALMAVVPLQQAGQIWVDANFKETQLAQMRIGQPVTLKSDLYGGEAVYHGKVDSLGVGTGSAFSLLPAQNATGNWIKIVQRLPVRIALDPKELEKSPLRIGLSMRAEVDLHDRSGPALAAHAPGEPKFTTDVYAGQAQGAEAVIERIVHENAAHAGEDDRRVSQR